MQTKKDIILFINSVPKSAIDNLKEHFKSKNEKFKFGLLSDIKNKVANKDSKGIDLKLECDFSKSLKIAKTVFPIRDRVAALVARGETNANNLSKIVPYFPYLNLPTESSLEWATNKISMRQRMKFYNPEITPQFAIVHDDSPKALDKIRSKVKFPLVLKPAGLAASMLVSVCYHEEELAKTLKKITRKIKKSYRELARTEKPTILAESLMEGEMYSVDAYVDSKGKVSFCPLVYVKTGKNIGFDDFFGYMRITPVKLNDQKIKQAEKVATDSIHALSLRSTTAHIELMLTEDGWKIIELSPRIGGFRDSMYKLSYGINHTLNDVLIKLDEKPIIPKRQKGYTAVLQFFAKKEGILEKLQGLQKIKKLKSFIDISVHKKVGDKCLFAKHGGRSIFDLTLFNKERSDLLGDIRRVEQGVKITTK